MKRDKKEIHQFNKLLTSLKIESYICQGPGVLWSRIDSSTDPRDQFELDMIGKIETDGLLIEVTTEQNNLRSYIKSKIQTWNRYVRAFKQNPRKAIKGLGAIPASRLSEFSRIRRWKYICVLVSHGKETIKPESFGHDPIQPLFIMDEDELNYIKAIAGSLGKYAKNELYGFLGFDVGELKDIQGRKDFALPCIKINDRIVSRDRSIKADVYQLRMPVNCLLDYAKVYRYGSLDGNTSASGYQRLLNSQKLSLMAKNFVQNNPHRIYPTPITLILPAECKPRTGADGYGTIKISGKYASLDIIDGQHRVYSYIHTSEKTRDRARLLATAIKFHSKNEKLINKFAARVFVEINGTQSKVKKSLEYLLLWDVLGERDSKAIASKIIMTCTDRGRASPLSKLFQINPTRKHCRPLNISTLPITTIVEELAKQIRPCVETRSRFSGSILKRHQRKFRYSGTTSSADHFVAVGSQELEGFFTIVREIFSEDWRPDSGSALLSSNYISASIRLMFALIKKGRFSHDSWRKVFSKIKSKARSLHVISVNDPTFPDANEKVLPKKSGAEAIYDYYFRPYVI